ncbi:tetratricopeptide repeat-containing sulfotransferase family protein [Dyella terrae]|uniref:tetratricopeptide repeat-containing sulfotransferase family protein n=1 Tax=Dyella terrae TaxID=522259 RepID=UPI001EFD5601|nr:sulfotransferase [Dyella terrae]
MITPASSSKALVESMLAAYNAGDMTNVQAMGESVRDLASADDMVLLLLGAARQATGSPESAVALFRQLVQRKPHVSEYWNNLGLAARQAGDYALAEQALGRAIELAPSQAEVHYNLGLLYAHQQRWLTARETLLQAVGLAPDFIEARLQAAYACHFCGDTRGAEVMLDGADTWPPQAADQALILATILSSLGYQDAAFRTLAQAILPEGPERPSMERRIVAMRASMFERSNQIDEACAELSQLPLDVLTSLSPGEWELRHAGLQVHANIASRQGQLEQAATWFEQLQHERSDAHLQANAAFSVASIRNKQGRHDEAWHALDAAHAAQLRFASDFVPELLTEGSQPLDMVEHAVDRRAYDGWSALRAPRSQDSPVFVVGFPRSGTTLLEQMLDAHPAFRSMDERAFVYELIKRMQLAGQSYPADLASLTQANTDQLRDIYAGVVRRVVPDLGSRQLVDKNPLNMLCLPMIMRLFPDARIIMCLRHPCDVLLSCYMQPFRSPAFMVLCSSLERLARGYVDAFEHWFRHVEVFAPRVLEWRYESVVSRFDEHLVRLGEFLQLDDSAPMARFAEHARGKGYISTPSYAQVTEGIHRKAVGRWQAYRDKFEPVLPILRPMMERLGYSE